MWCFLSCMPPWQLKKNREVISLVPAYCYCQMFLCPLLVKEVDKETMCCGCAPREAFRWIIYGWNLFQWLQVCRGFLAGSGMASSTQRSLNLIASSNFQKHDKLNKNWNFKWDCGAQSNPQQSWLGFPDQVTVEECRIRIPDRTLFQAQRKARTVSKVRARVHREDYLGKIFYILRIW